MGAAQSTDEKPAYYDTELFPKLKVFADHFEQILEEARNLLKAAQLDTRIERPVHVWEPESGKPFIRKLAENDKWFYAWDKTMNWWNYVVYYYGDVLPGRTRELCPVTCSIVEKLEGIRICGFSFLPPNGKIHPHRDGTGRRAGSLAYHLCLFGKATLTVDWKPELQEPGKVIILDTEYLHCVENMDNERMILYIEFEYDKHCADPKPYLAPGAVDVADDAETTGDATEQEDGSETVPTETS
eukprot:TRINITY_DN4234_c0_g1_i2.p1 TRINITY_DN4234_c0_g1~~TRINITY_DN4234_c0_g1_i2.p1  ORF type:complete len:242 (+),score=29.01 TRINITY_DN4234_c0_g1_i2:527-1252(+)